MFTFRFPFISVFLNLLFIYELLEYVLGPLPAEPVSKFICLCRGQDTSQPVSLMVVHISASHPKLAALVVRRMGALHDPNLLEPSSFVLVLHALGSATLNLGHSLTITSTAHLLRLLGNLMDLMLNL